MNPSTDGGRVDAELTPLSFAQQRIWFVSQLEPESTAYHAPRLTRWRGPLDVEALARSLTEVVRRHEVLRTRFPAVGGRPIQEVSPAGQFPMAVLDFSGAPASKRDAMARERAITEARAPFDLGRGPLLRATLLRVSPDEHLLLLVAHHIVIDGWSTGLLLRELGLLYSSFVSGSEAALPEIPAQYRDYALWQRERLQGAALERDLAYWRAQLADAAPVLELPTDRARGASRNEGGAQVRFTLPENLVDTLTVLSRRERVTPFMTLLGAFQVLLCRYSGQTDVIVGTPVAGRDRKELENLVGCFANTLALRTDCSGRPTFRQLLARVREVALGAYEHQDMPFEKIVEELHLDRSLRVHPVFQVLFNFRNYPVPPLQAAPMQVEDVELERDTAKFDLELSLIREAGALQGVLSYPLDLFEHATACHMVEQYRLLLEQVAATPDCSIHAYSLMTGRSGALLPDPNAPLPEPAYTPVTELFARLARQAPTHPAVQQGEHGWTYGELAAAADGLARSLRMRGIVPGDVIAVTGAPGFGLVAGMLAILEMGGVMVPIAADLPQHRKRLMVEEAKAGYVLRIGEAGAEPAWVVDLGGVAVLDIDENTGRLIRVRGSEAELDAAAIVLPTPGPDDPAYIFFTSGTTGVPKAVLGVHKGLSHFIAWQQAAFGIGSSDRCAQLTNISFDVVLRDVFLPLTSGGTLCFPPKQLPPDRVLAWLDRAAVTVLHAVPSLAQAWLEHWPRGRTLHSLRWVFFAGEPLTDTLVRRWRQASMEACGVINLYGPTETTMVKCWYRVPAEPVPGIQPVGHALPQTQALVLAEDGRLCAVSEAGEIVLRTPFRTRGYVNATEEQRRRFIPSPFTGDPEDVLYRTGDLGRYRADGMLMVLARLDHQVKIRGVRVEPDEVGVVLSRHGAVRACAVVARPLGQQAVALVAYLVADRAEITPTALRAYLAERMPSAFVPSHFVFLDRLPLAPNGKLDRRALPLPDPSADSLEVDLGPGTPLEEKLAGIWASVLQVARVRLSENFFDLGGHSLLATQVVARTEEACGVEIPLRALFEEPTLASLAARIQATLDARGGEGSRLVSANGRAPRDGSFG